MTSRYRYILLFLLLLSNGVMSKQALRLSESYLPVAMQLIAHFTDQMDHLKATDLKPTTTAKPTTTTTTKPPRRPATSFQGPETGIYTWTEYPNSALDTSTPTHWPGVYAPMLLPHHQARKDKNDGSSNYVLLPAHQQGQKYSVIKAETPSYEQLLEPQTQEFGPVPIQAPPSVLLPPVEHELFQLHHINEPLPLTDSSFYESDLMLTENELSDDNLQHLSSDIRQILKLAHNKNDDRLFVNRLEERQSIGSPGKAAPNKMSQSNLRLTLLYDLLSRDAKKQNLSVYSGYSDAVLKKLSESSNRGPRHQLRDSLKSMVDRKDCNHDYANNRAKEMIKELDSDTSVLSKEIGVLEPLLFALE